MFLGDCLTDEDRRPFLSLREPYKTTVVRPTSYKEQAVWGHLTAAVVCYKKFQLRCTATYSRVSALEKFTLCLFMYHVHNNCSIPYTTTAVYSHCHYYALKARGWQYETLGVFSAS